MASRPVMAEWLNRLGFVRWDRLIAGDEKTYVYGWIDRDDGRSDFVILDFWTEAPEVGPGFNTSSATRDAEIQVALFPDRDPGEHNPCQRVEAVFGPLVENAIRLGR